MPWQGWCSGGWINLTSYAILGNLRLLVKIHPLLGWPQVAPGGEHSRWESFVGAIDQLFQKVSVVAFQIHHDHGYISLWLLQQDPLAQKCNPVVLLLTNVQRWILKARLHFKNPIVWTTLYLEGILRHMWTWSSIKCPSNNFRSFAVIIPSAPLQLASNRSFRDEPFKTPKSR